MIRVISTGREGTRGREIAFSAIMRVFLTRNARKSLVRREGGRNHFQRIVRQKNRERGGGEGGLRKAGKGRALITSGYSNSEYNLSVSFDGNYNGNNAFVTAN